MLYILAVFVALIVAAIIYILEIQEKEEELKGQLTKSDLRELMRFYNDNLKNRKR